MFIRVNRLKADKLKLINTFEENGMIPGRDFFTGPFGNIGVDEVGEGGLVR